MNHPKPFRVGIIGAGPSGSTLACLLKKGGVDAVIFDENTRPSLIVGESLVPLLVPVFQRLGVEEKVAKIGTKKPGVTWTLKEGDALKLSFRTVEGVLPTYAYNVSRREFDEIITQAALEVGVELVHGRVVLEKVEKGGDTLPQLSKETLDLIPRWEGKQPDLLIDASGRRRLFAKLLGIQADLGPRKDISHFAHYTGCDPVMPAGTTMIYRLKEGWGWRIPLVDKMSMGVVIQKDHLHKYGKTPEEQLEGIFQANPMIADQSKNRQRITPVTSYANYQLISHRGCGRNWCSVGDAFGFVDPMLSPGLAMAMTTAEKLADLILELPKNSNDDWMSRFEYYLTEFRAQLVDWQTLIDYFYDGRIFALYRMGEAMKFKYPGKVSDFMESHMTKLIASMAAGAKTSHPYNKSVLKFMTRFGLGGHEAAPYQVN